MDKGGKKTKIKDAKGGTHEVEQVPHLMQLLETRFNVGAFGFQIEQVKGVSVDGSDWL